MLYFKCLIVALFMPCMALAAQDQLQNCFRLAALPVDPRNEFEGVPLGELDGPAIISACGPGLSDDDDGKVHFHLGRGYFALGDLGKALGLFHESAMRGYPVAFFALAVAHHLGDGTQRDFDLAESYYLIAKSLGVKASKDALILLDRDRKATFIE
mgnify:CR=1 FL=1